MVTRRAALSVKILRQSNNCCLRHIGNQGINQIVALPGNVGQTIEGAYVRHAIRYILAISAISGCLLAEAGNDIEGEEIIVASIHVGRDAPVHEEAKPTTYQVEIGDRRAWWRREQDLTGEPASKRIGIACGDIERPTTIDERAQLVDRGFCNLQSARRWILVEQNDTRRREQQNQGEHSQQSEPAGNPRIDSADRAPWMTMVGLRAKASEQCRRDRLRLQRLAYAALESGYCFSFAATGLTDSEMGLQAGAQCFRAFAV